MTSPTSALTKRPVHLAARFPATPARGHSRQAFTLIELLVVIGIIVVLIGILVPSTMKAYKQAARTATANDLQAIGGALEAYKQDHGDYPRITATVATNDGFDNAIALCQALLGPTDADDLDDDDKNGNPLTGTENKDFGARLRPGGKVYGPYLPADRFKTQIIDPSPVAPLEPQSTMVLLDRGGKPILYFPAHPAKANIRLPGGYVSNTGTPRYDARGNSDTTGTKAPFTRDPADTFALNRIQLIFRDYNMNGTADSTDEPVDLPFVLYSAGPDEAYGPNANMGGDRTALDRADADECDDVTNFR